MLNFIEIGGVTRKPLVDLTWNDPIPLSSIPGTLKCLQSIIFFCKETSIDKTFDMNAAFLINELFFVIQFVICVSIIPEMFKCLQLNCCFSIVTLCTRDVSLFRSSKRSKH